jgi:hypothetical protein
MGEKEQACANDLMCTCTKFYENDLGILLEATFTTPELPKVK